MLDKGRVRPATPIARYYWDTMMEVQDAVFSTGADPKATLAAAARDLQVEQDRYNARTRAGVGK